MSSLRHDYCGCTDCWTYRVGDDIMKAINNHPTMVKAELMDVIEDCLELLESLTGKDLTGETN